MSLVYHSGDLDAHVIPTHYHIKLAPRADICTGKATINLDISAAFSSRSILLHADPRVGITYASIEYLNEERQEVRLESPLLESAACVPFALLCLILALRSSKWWM